ncbi:MAG: hypothetical protein CLLPBCKN_006334 [Chroococcidiopsis cubana SAG 39.79]|uniref:hypothetical protein n=1 Tax=Chroococcidiopsis cubana TaxID=171392 RepID=UPI000F8E9B27|nr:hypothetical protein [Chroococcidiopsis cubana]MDZ4876899.1 hypothetical protein [Chroococcidiopsis cubana SAG 39.79]
MSSLTIHVVLFAVQGFENELEKGGTATAVTTNDCLLPFSIHLSTLIKHIKKRLENFTATIFPQPLDNSS